MKKGMTFEKAMERLQAITEMLGAGTESLDQSLKLYAEGAELLSFCNTQLENARLTIEKLYPTSEFAKEEDSVNA